MYLTDDIFDDEQLTHGFFGRRGGVSRGIYDSLNCGIVSGDEPEAVRENRRLVAKDMGVRRERLLTMRQVHGDTCLIVENFWEDAGPEGDAMVTDVPGIALGILTADCAPVLLAGRTKGGAPVIGAAHAGWKGALGGIIESTVAAMVAKGASLEGIHAAIGPCIGLESYEVDADFCLPFIDHNNDSAAFFFPCRHGGKYLFDLPGYVSWRLKRAGVRGVSVKGIDTCFNEEDYFSFRRATHRGEPDYGRQASVIVIKH